MSRIHIATSSFALLSALLWPAALHAQDVADPPVAEETAPPDLEAGAASDAEGAPEAEEAAPEAEAAAPEAEEAAPEAEAVPLPPEPDAFGDGEPLPDAELDEGGAGDAQEEGISTAVWATAGVAAGSVIVGTVFGFLALSEQASFEDAPTEEKADRGETYALLADVFLFTALASGVTALVLHYGRRSDGDEEDAADEVAIDITPVVGRRAGGLSARMRF